MGGQSPTVNRERLIDGLESLCRVDSGSRQERQMADRMRAELEALGFTVTEDGAAAVVGGNTGNLIARLPGTRAGAEPILLSAHMDRVPGGLGIQPQRLADRITSDGTTILGADDAAGLAAILEAVRSAQEQGIDLPPVEVVLTVCEEVGLLGAQALDPAQLQSKMAFVLDADGPVGTVVVQAPSQTRVVASFTGRSAHAGLEPERGVSAIQMAARAIERMPLGRIDHETTANIGVINGGVARNVVPDSCQLLGEARSLVDAKLEAQVGAMVGALEQAAADFGGTVQVETVAAYRAFHLADEAPVVSRAAEAIRALGLNPILKATGGGSDANILNNMGIPTVGICTGYQEIHTYNEYMPLDELVRLAQVTLSLLVG